MFSSIGKAAATLGALMILLVAACGGVGLWSAGNTLGSIADMSSVNIVVQRHMESDMKHDAIRGDVAAAIAALDPKTGISMVESKKAIRDDSAVFLKSVAEAEQNANDPAVLAALKSLNVPLKAYVEGAKEISQTLDDDPARAAVEFPAFEKKFLTLQDAMDKASQAIEAYASAKNAEEIAKAGRVRFLLIGSLLASILLLGLVGWIVRAGLIRPLGALGMVTHHLAEARYETEVPEVHRRDELGSVARGLVALRDAGRQKVALEAETARSLNDQVEVVNALSAGLANMRGGDFTKLIEGVFPPEYALLQDNFNHAVSALREMMQIVNEITDSIRSKSQDIAASADQGARQTESNAASLEQTSAALSQIDRRLKDSAAASQNSVERADKAKAAVERGRAVAGEAGEVMGLVRESAKGIDAVIEGLDKIAFQTRVLAMNAAVEAGRAGESGRGFAVVADLVSALAMRAEEEAQLARSQLSVTQEQVLSAVSAVDRVDAALEAIASDVDEVHVLLGTMANDNRAQAMTVTEISSAVASMDSATQKNAAMVERTASAARELRDDVDALVAKAQIFQFERRKQKIPVAIERRRGGVRAENAKLQSEYSSPQRALASRTPSIAHST